ncbi:MAG: hypothetical protein QXF15_01370 [Candidatus Aenigmatarchaeota archaeon]
MSKKKAIKLKLGKCDFCDKPAEVAVGEFKVCPLHVRRAEIESGIYEQG